MGNDMAERANIMRKSVTIPAACKERFVPLDHPLMARWRRAGVTMSGVSECAPGYCITAPAPRELMLIATTGGSGWAATPAGTETLEAGSLFIGVPGEAVGWGIAGASWRLAWWYLTPLALWRPLVDGRGGLRGYPRGALLEALLRDLIERLSAPAGHDDDIARHHADAILLLLRELAGTSLEAPEDGFTVLWREVAGSLHEPWSVPSLARRLGHSPSTLQRVCTRRFGHGAHQELLRLRMVHARKVLQSTAYPLRVVAELVGYGDPFTFSAAYRRWSGHAPRQERRMHPLRPRA
jgi:AraC family transcriptional regulator of arabinose operon